MFDQQMDVNILKYYEEKLYMHNSSDLFDFRSDPDCTPNPGDRHQRIILKLMILRKKMLKQPL